MMLALLTRISSGPSRRSVSSTSAAAATGSATSQRIAITSAPRRSRSSRARSSSSLSRAQMARRHPSRASSRAIRKPRPREPPVTMATAPKRSSSCAKRRRALAKAATVPSAASAKRSMGAGGAAPMPATLLLREPGLHEGVAVVGRQRRLVAADLLVAEKEALHPADGDGAGGAAGKDVALELLVELAALVLVRLLRRAVDQIVRLRIRELRVVAA